jgi:arylsulfatase A-like enzyme
LNRVIQLLFFAGVFIAVESFAGTALCAPNIIVIMTDDMGYADLGIYGQEKDVKTPHLDRLARDGVLCTAGYITAPQCAPSRMGLLTGRYQQRAGVDTIPDMPMPLAEVTLAERLRDVGYKTGMVGKWHLDPGHWSIQWAREQGLDEYITQKDPRFPGRDFLLIDEIVDELREYYPGNQGFDEYFYGEYQRYWRNFSRDGKTLGTPKTWKHETGFREDIKTEAALAFIERNKDKPFFLYLAYYAPHTPLESTPEYLARFPGEMAERRRYGLSMISAVDDGVGRVRELLKENKLDQDTLIFFLSDNGAPLKMTMLDEPISKLNAKWDGSKNTPWVGEKGMLTEGGIRVPFIVSWPGRIQAGQTCDQPVSSLDIVPTALAVAGQKIPEDLDGVNLLPWFWEKANELPERDLFWRFWAQGAIRRSNWKYITLSDGRDGLYDLSTDVHEQENLIKEHPEKAQQLRMELEAWMNEINPPGLDTKDVNGQEKTWYRFYKLMD